MIAATKVERVPLGRTKLNVSNICFGTSALGDMPGTYGYGVEEKQAKDTVRAILAGPTNFLDTSRNYGLGRSEQRIGDVIRESGGLPKGFILSTKLDRDVKTNRFDGSQARRSLEESLKALSLDRIHLLHVHDPEHAASLQEATGPTGAISELFKMRDEGLAEAIGLAAGPVDIMTPILRDWDFDVLITHNRFTLLNRNAEILISYAYSKGVAVLNAAPYASGILAKGPGSYPRYVYQEASEEILAHAGRVEAICSKHKIPLGAAALQFSMRDARITSTICGISKPERVSQTIEWATWPIPDEAWEELMSLPSSAADPEASREYTLG